MRILRSFTVAVATLLALGEVGRWWCKPNFLPLAFDELILAAAMLAAALASRRIGAAPLAAAWGGYCGFVLGLLVPTLDHLLFGPPKPSATFYSIILTAMLLVGVSALVRSLVLCRGSTPAR